MTDAPARETDARAAPRPETLGLRLARGRPGLSARTIPPASGTAPATVSQGKPFSYSLTARSMATSTTAPKNMDSA